MCFPPLSLGQRRYLADWTYLQLGAPFGVAFCTGCASTDTVDEPSMCKKSPESAFQISLAGRYQACLSIMPSTNHGMLSYQTMRGASSVTRETFALCGVWCRAKYDAGRREMVGEVWAGDAKGPHCTLIPKGANNGPHPDHVCNPCLSNVGKRGWEVAKKGEDGLFITGSRLRILFLSGGVGYFPQP
ncbi:hypothetical protein NA56DRAFT_120587 [Hyaloscypha hepaticicola]|uniref:Uncharacterized protein n=1 Tax=Hyaloscypha hepaticicola TaxID=2082293 RepID=A0A2J6Q650_9HELO|nr:hypothetical protein NA56DRAFT_120587 [Hyaloscypha hepaticicola]